MANAGALTNRFSADDGSAPYESMRFVPLGRRDPFYGALVESVEEAVHNVFTGAHSMTGRAGHHAPHCRWARCPTCWQWGARCRSAGPAAAPS
ncbi:hypothetical protein ABZY45_34855 [Streptomyces sp. NPDC006516]|uniref:hypothetical protein n=1 Tax=Streptomyces sp. NPDC006516 TaxID=3154309 RepID=UPI0033BE0F11